MARRFKLADGTVGMLDDDGTFTPGAEDTAPKTKQVHGGIAGPGSTDPDEPTGLLTEGGGSYDEQSRMGAEAADALKKRGHITTNLEGDAGLQGITAGAMAAPVGALAGALPRLMGLARLGGVADAAVTGGVASKAQGGDFTTGAVLGGTIPALGAAKAGVGAVGDAAGRVMASPAVQEAAAHTALGKYGRVGLEAAKALRGGPAAPVVEPPPAPAATPEIAQLKEALKTAKGKDAVNLQAIIANLEKRAAPSAQAAPPVNPLVAAARKQLPTNPIPGLSEMPRAPEGPAYADTVPQGTKVTSASRPAAPDTIVDNPITAKMRRQVSLRPEAPAAVPPQASVVPIKPAPPAANLPTFALPKNPTRWELEQAAAWAPSGRTPGFAKKARMNLDDFVGMMMRRKQAAIDALNGSPPIPLVQAAQTTKARSAQAAANLAAAGGR